VVLLLEHQVLEDFVAELLLGFGFGFAGEDGAGVADDVQHEQFEGLRGFLGRGWRL
jgi:hypothetical protein